MAKVPDIKVKVDVMLAAAHPDFILKLETIKGEPLTYEQWEQVKRNIVRSDPRLDALLAAAHGVVDGGIVKRAFAYTALRDALAAFEEAE